VDLVAQQLLRAIRGRRSQIAFARRLGYRGNPITDWERGCTYPTARETLRACQRVGIDVVTALQRFGNVVIESGREGYQVGPWLSTLAGVSPTELSRRVGRSRSAVSRWLSGTAHPRLPDFLALVDAATGRLPELVSELVPIETVPALRGRHEATLAARRLAFDAPWTEAVLRLLETRGYAEQAQHDAGWVAQVLGLDQKDVKNCLTLLEAAGLVRFDGQRYVNLEGLSVDTRGGKKALHALKAHWANVAAARARDPERGDLLAYNVLSVSTQDMQRIHELLMESYRQVRAIVAASHPPEQVGLVNIHFLKWPRTHPLPA
jgi:transcriptional regulator with XRE-family HTH domain